MDRVQEHVSIALVPLRMIKDPEWKIGMHWVLKATFYSDSTVDRTIGFAGSKGGFLTIKVPAGAQGWVKEVAGPVGQAADKLEFQHLSSTD